MISVETGLSNDLQTAKVPPDQMELVSTFHCRGTTKAERLDLCSLVTKDLEMP